jgi:prepilin peptidase CpaA
MTAYHLLMYVPLLALLAWAAATDLRARRIPNWLSFTLILTGLLQCLTAGSTTSLLASVTGLLLGFALTFLFFAVGAMGGGDVKLLTGVGAWLGPWGVLLVFAVEAIVGMVQAMIQAASQRRLGAVLRNSVVLAGGLAGGGGGMGIGSLPSSNADPAANKQILPYSVPVLIATVVVLAAKWGMS